MKRLNLPSKYRNHGLHIWCITCKKAVTSSPCKHADQQRFQSRVYNPFTKKQDCIKSYDTKNADEAFDEHLAYKANLKRNSYNIPTIKPSASAPSELFLNKGVGKYFDYLHDIGVPEYEKKGLTKEYISDQKRYLARFILSIKKVHNKIGSLPVTSLSQEHVSVFDEYVRALNLSQNSYNAHIKAVKYFVDYLIGTGIEMKNPFSKVKLKTVQSNPEIIPVEEFEQFLSAVKPENGWGIKGKKREEKVNYYRPWLKKVFALSLLTGERLDGIVLLKWSHVEGNFLKIPNWKVNRIQKSEGYYSYTPITVDLAELLVDFKMSDPDSHIIVPEQRNRATLKKFITKSFTHFWRATGINREVSFKHLRKTYITRLTSLIGEQALFVKHSSDKTAIKHYLNQKELLEKTKDTRLYDISKWLT